MTKLYSIETDRMQTGNNDGKKALKNRIVLKLSSEADSAIQTFITLDDTNANTSL